MIQHLEAVNVISALLKDPSVRLVVLVLELQTFWSVTQSIESTTLTNLILRSS